MVKAVTCEVKRRGIWEEIDIAEAIGIRRDFEFRCGECHGKVQAHRRANNGMMAHFEHRLGHEGCSRSGKFNGRCAPHPEALR